ncbi:GNAT family N-acetyltransferase [Nocardia inohanensis]|uniref:GNAT family N-acetyltransferase n=1 Tax=Nocardia inohanensis TaxID=209246 RepID=UPI000835D62B|nr:GNAT family N-acetyltransferase [Nocardia inohanensis]
MFCGIELGARIERVETDLVAKGAAAAHLRRGDGSGFLIPVAGGMASYAEPGSPLNKVAGLGFDGVPSESELDEIETQFAKRDTPVQVELSHLADPAIGELLTGRGYRLLGYENVLGLALAGFSATSLPADVVVSRSGESEFDTWLGLVADGFSHPDTQGLASHEEFPAEIIANAVRDLAGAAGVLHYLAHHDGVPAGGASLRLAEGVAQLTGAATIPAHRRRGVQSALLTTRLADAVAAGCDIATLTTQPASKSQQNAQAKGFALLYPRAMLVKS